jgi:acyl carrier protein
VHGWDSLMNVRLFVATEMEFGTRFDTAEINSLRNVGDLVRLIKAKEHS